MRPSFSWAIARPILPLTGLRLWMGRLLGGLFSHAGGTDALRKARQRSRTVGGPMGPALFATSGPMGHERHEGPEVPTVTIHRPCVRLLSITLACCQEPVQTKKRVGQPKNRRDHNNRAVTRYYPLPFSQVRRTKTSSSKGSFLYYARHSIACYQVHCFVLPL